MWFEILPSFGIVTVFMSVPGFAMYGLHKLVLGNAYRRNTDERWERVMYVRDMRLTGNPYQGNGLESIPDKN
ncbi:NADH dehydrogenase [ubiquinone] 1 alpha subcomplex subunit 1 [Toxorhynchites rutilus septentrionalis]|uniref:NADH dehydrogenase [ubiquinone] 1 alpha subcomplex subunit 1 n=1 Tax=Toxorhynchites rutilus septentrionalis TaxID=329112 RepID=UPI00247AE45A|nr:NADH dehydrogenase [ubiquinone] 1 alpha subcomplex subunit 1 [Toxorhynchites rutilus septentrionalis]